MRVLVLGATGYVGSRLVPRLLDAGHEVRCLARTPGHLDRTPWRHRVEVVRGDVLEAASLHDAFDGIDTGYYLVHDLGGRGFAAREERAARLTRTAAVAAGVGHLVYLGGLADDREALGLSPHLWSRTQVGRVLASDPQLAVTELRASLILGAGSASFELLRAVLDTFPILPDVAWLDTECQPVAIDDVLDVLVDVAAPVRGGHRVVAVAGAEMVAYHDLVALLAEVTDRRAPRTVQVPFVDAPIAALVAGWVTPLPGPLVQTLVASLANPTVAPPDAERLPPRPVPLREAMRRAVRHPAPPPEPAAADPSPLDPAWSGAVRFHDVREVACRAPADRLWHTVLAIGGRTGWYGTTPLWRVRGALDRLVGGAGWRTGRPRVLRPGDRVDAWRVEEVGARRLTLRSEMRLPGEALLTFAVEERGDGSRLVQRNEFRPDGLGGRLYWYAVLPAHVAAMEAQVRGVVAAAERAAGG